MKLTSLFLTLGLFAAQSLQATDLCTPLELEDPTIKERARIVHFPGDRSIILLGHEHGDRNVLKRFAHWAQDRDDELSNDEWREHVQEFIKKNDKTLAHVKQDLGFLRASLWETQEPIFVAIESQDDDVAEHAVRAMRVRSALSQAFWKRGLEDAMLLRDAELIYMGGALYSYLYDNELKGKYELVGMEGRENAALLQKRGKKTMHIAETRLTAIKAKQEFDEDIVKKAMALVVDEMNEAYDDIAMILVYDHETIRTRFEDRYRNLDPKVRGAVLSYLYGYLDYLRGMKKRDVFFSRKLANQERSGVFFVGEEHLVSLAKLLRLQCKTLEAGLPVYEEVPPEPVIDEM